MYHEKIDSLLDTYARKLAANMNKGYEIAGRVPSVLIAGGSNFPVRKKEKQNAAADSLSVSDVVVLHQDEQDAAHYVDSISYRQVPKFLNELQKELIPDDFLTGEKSRTPRGTFSLTDMSHKQMKEAGYGFHHQSDDGKYHIMANGTRAFAIAAEQPEKVNPVF